MARIHVEEDWEKEADENLFPSDQCRRGDGVHICRPSAMSSASPTPTNREGIKIEERKKKTFNLLKV